MWCWWSARNKTNAGERRKSAQEVVNDVIYYVTAWNQIHHQSATKAKQPVKIKWAVPPEDANKINCDGAFLTNTGQDGWRFVIRDHTGYAVAAGAGAAEPLINARHAEAVACIKGLEHASMLGLECIILETDAEVVVNAIKDLTFDKSPLGVLFREIRTKMFYDFNVCTVSHCPQACNAVAPSLAAMGLSCKNDPLLWQDQVHESVALLVSSDLSRLN
jgi:ribonuclease HI